jgi:hypothetical protein
MDAGVRETMDAEVAEPAEPPVRGARRRKYREASLIMRPEGLASWMANATPGSSIVYYIGLLARDRAFTETPTSDGSPFDRETCATIARIGDLAFGYEEGGLARGEDFWVLPLRGPIRPLDVVCMTSRGAYGSGCLHSILCQLQWRPEGL